MWYFIIIYLIGVIIAYICGVMYWRGQNYTQIIWSEHGSFWRRMSLLSWLQVLAILLGFSKSMKFPKSWKEVFIPILLISVSFTSFSQDCPRGGDNKNSKLQHQDSLKNRVDVPKQYNHVSFQELAAFTVNSTHLLQAVTLKGYVLDIKPGGAESCNCHTTDQTKWDSHIVLVADSTVTTQCDAIVCEVTQYSRQYIGLTTAELKKKFLHKYVIVQGYLFCDKEHFTMSKADKCHPNNCYRATTYEIHPVFNIH